MENLKDLLNEKQYEAVTSNDKYLRIIAGAGSGKTRVITYRISYLIDTLGYYPSSIVAITFSNKAAEEIKERVENFLKMGKIKMTISTFHAYCARILREDCKLINYPENFTILDEDDQKKIVKNIINDITDEDVKYTAEQLKIGQILDYIADKKSAWVTPEVDLKQTSNNKFNHVRAIIYDAYEKELQKNFALDFDDLILKAIVVLENNEVIKDKWQQRIQHLLVDEFQDVDDNQYRLLKLLAGKNGEITVVGDPDQTIYSWRGANIDIILNFDKDFPTCKTISLEQNYRSSGNILKVANTLIEHNHNRIKKNLFTKADKGFEIVTYNAENEIKEARFVVDNIRDICDGKTTFYRDCAVLYRNNSQSARIEECLMNYGIKYRIYGGLRFYRRMEIKDLIAFLRLGTNSKDNLACERLIENTGKGIGRTTVEKIRKNSAFDNMSYFDHLKFQYDNLESLYRPQYGKALKNFVDQIKELHDLFMFEPKLAYKHLDEHLHRYGYIDMLLHLEMDDKIENIHKFIEQMETYLKLEENSLVDFVQSVTLLSAQDEIDDETDDFVKLMTVHTAKGLEFDNVFVFGLVDEIFPNRRTMDESRDGLEEERRLFYVAITRARKRLYLTTSGGQSYMGLRHPSRFLREIRTEAEKFNVKITQGETIKKDPTVVNNVRPGQMIRHDIYGEGIIISKSADGFIEVVFHNPAFGRKKLNANHRNVHPL